MLLIKLIEIHPLHKVYCTLKLLLLADTGNVSLIKLTSVVLYDEELKRSFGWKTDVSMGIFSSLLLKLLLIMKLLLSVKTKSSKSSSD